MSKAVRGFFIVVFLFAVVPFRAFGETGRDGGQFPDSLYIERDEESTDREGRGLLDFLPFFGDNSRRVPSEDLKPSPLPRESKPVLKKDELEELQAVVNEWILTSDATEPKLRTDQAGRYYRDYVVFEREYRIEVLRGKTEEHPFLAHVYVSGDYFRTKSHYDPAEAQSDFNFNYEKLDFRIIFERVEHWEYSDDSSQEPFVFREEWEFRKTQSRSKVTNSERSQNSEENATGSEGHPGGQVAF